MELILSAIALREQTVPTTANTAPSDAEFPDLQLAAGAPRPAKIDATLNTSLGFGGANACMILSRPGTKTASERARREVCISGIGVILRGAIGNDAFVRRLGETPSSPMRDSGSVPEDGYIHLLNARRVRRMSDYVKLTLASATLAFADAGVAENPSFSASCSAILGSTHAGAAYCVSYYEQIVREGISAANPMLFAEGVPNSAAAHLSLMLSLKGSCQSLIGTRTAGLDALRLAFYRITCGEWDRAVVSAAEEFVPTVNQAYAHCGLYAPENRGGAFGGDGRFSVGCGAVTFIVESRDAIERRGGKSRGSVLACGGAAMRADHAIEDIAHVLEAIHAPRHVISSANGTWIDRAEAAAIARSAQARVVSSIYGLFPETFSVGPLAGIAAALLTRKLPQFHGEIGQMPEGLEIASEARAATSMGVLCTGFNGTVAGATISVAGF